MGRDAEVRGSTANTSRRDFLKAGAAGALVVGFNLLPVDRALAAETPPGDTFAPNAFLRIARDGTVTVFTGSSEMGQGVLTAIPMLLVEELDADWRKVRVEQAPVDPKFNHPTYRSQVTAGSSTIRAFWTPVRKAGAQARAMLLAAAAERWQVDATTLRTEDGFVHGPGGKRVGYGALAADASRHSPPADPPLKEAGSRKLMGKPLPRLDTPGKTNGTARFAMDVHVPGRLVAVMAHAPALRAVPTRYDEAAAKAIKGVRQVVVLPAGVAVLADGFWAARKGRDALQVQWDLGAQGTLSSARIGAMLVEGTAASGPAVARQIGDVHQVQGSVQKAQYTAPYLAHACMEPMNCTASVRNGEAAVWVGTQAPGPLQQLLAKELGIPQDKVAVHTMLLGGGFGRRYASEFAVSAALLSKASGRPVQLVYTREDDMAGGYYRPAAAAAFEATLDANGRPQSLHARVAAPSIAIASGGKLPENGVDRYAVEGIHDNPYDIPNQLVTYSRVEPGPQAWFWRSVGFSQNIFFMESFVDELAAAGGKDPYEFRRSLLAKQPRLRSVLELAAEKAGWGTDLPAGVHRGIAVAQGFGSYAAEVAEVSMESDGKVRVRRVVAALDAGQVVNPEIIRRQAESAIVYGLSAFLYGNITFANGRAEQSNFHDYPVLRMNEMPRVEVHLVPSTEAPGGAGEPATPAIAPAVANAIYAASGKRVRNLPFSVSGTQAS